MWGYWSSVTSHKMSLRRSLSRPFSALLNVVYFSGAGIFLNGKCRHSRTMLSKMAMHTDAIHAFAWMQRYTLSINISHIRMLLDSHLICMSAIMSSILSRKNL